MSVVLVAVASQMVRRNGLPQRLPAEIAIVEAERHNKNPRQDECLDAGARCVFGGGQVEVMVFGDSHADSIVTAVADSLPQPSEQGVYFRGTSACLLVEGANWALSGKHKGCADLRDAIFAEIDTLHPGKPLILINRVTAYAMGDGFADPVTRPQRPMVYFSHKTEVPDERFLAEFRKNYIESTCRLARGRDLYVLMPVPDMPVDVPKAQGKAMLRGQSEEIYITLDEYGARNGFVREIMKEAANTCHVKLLDPVPYLCDQERCYGQRDGVPLYVDDDHLSMRGNRLLIPLFSPIFSRSAGVEVLEE